MKQSPDNHSHVASCIFVILKNFRKIFRVVLLDIGQLIVLKTTVVHYNLIFEIMIIYLTKHVTNQIILSGYEILITITSKIMIQLVCCSNVGLTRLKYFISGPLTLDYIKRTIVAQIRFKYAYLSPGGTFMVVPLRVAIEIFTTICSVHVKNSLTPLRSNSHLLSKVKVNTIP